MVIFDKHLSTFDNPDRMIFLKRNFNMKVTITDIAQAAGLSPATVSLVLNNRPSRISESTKNKVKALAQEMGYHPSFAAVNLRTSRSYTLGLVIPDIRNDYYATYAKGLEDVCQK